MKFTRSNTAVSAPELIVPKLKPYNVLNKSASVDFTFNTRSTRDILGRSDACTVFRGKSKKDSSKSVAVKCVEMWDAYELESLSKEFEIMKV